MSTGFNVHFVLDLYAESGLVIDSISNCNVNVAMKQ